MGVDEVRMWLYEMRQMLMAGESIAPAGCRIEALQRAEEALEKMPNPHIVLNNR